MSDSGEGDWNDPRDSSLRSEIQEWRTISGPNSTIKYSSYARHRDMAEDGIWAVLLGVGNKPKFDSSRHSTHVFSAAGLREAAALFNALADELDQKNGKKPKALDTPHDVRRKIDVSS